MIGDDEREMISVADDLELDRVLESLDRDAWREVDRQIVEVARETLDRVPTLADLLRARYERWRLSLEDRGIDPDAEKERTIRESLRRWAIRRGPLVEPRATVFAWLRERVLR